ncbi:MAG: hypothetical protein HYX23_00750 [Candidatus Zambryskibacteria bacterium]|nr:hypothetical protein [Candidatus Zambryskibacteria bacterium]
MPKDLIQKNIKLSHELDRYISNNPNAYRRIPKGAHIVITVTNDKKLSDANISLMRNSKSGQFVQAHKSRNRWVIKTLPKEKSQML